MSYVALLVDLDGTLIGRDERISPRVARAVARVSEHLSVSIATGREPAHVIEYATALGLTAPQVSDNGALILDPASGEEVWSAPLGNQHAKQIIATLQGRGHSFIATHPSGTITEADKVAGLNITRVSALDLEEEAEAEELVAHLGANRELHAVKVFLPYNGLWAVDLTRVGVNKGAAAVRIAALLGTGPEQMIGAGDSYNDLPMLEACGLGIAMGDSPPELKAIADYVAPPVADDGLAVAIEEFILPRL